MSSIHGYRRTSAEWKAMFDDEDVQVDMRQMLADYTELEHDLGIWQLRCGIAELDNKVAEVVWLLEHVEKKSDTTEWLTRRSDLISRIVGKA